MAEHVLRSTLTYRTEYRQPGTAREALAARVARLREQGTPYEVDGMTVRFASGALEARPDIELTYEDEVATA